MLSCTRCISCPFVNPSYVLLLSPTAKLKSGLCAETKAWRVAYGKASNKKYGAMMYEIIEFIEDIQKRLHRPIKDLDDIRYAIAALKQLRNEEIRVDMSIGPIEVREKTVFLGSH